MRAPAAGEARFLFGALAAEVKSTVLMPIAGLGMLAIGSHDTDRFHPGMGTVFLKLIAEAIAAAVARFPETSVRPRRRRCAFSITLAVERRYSPRTVLRYRQALDKLLAHLAREGLADWAAPAATAPAPVHRPRAPRRAAPASLHALLAAAAACSATWCAKVT